jgi:hypothetical protein
MATGSMLQQGHRTAAGVSLEKLAERAGLQSAWHLRSGTLCAADTTTEYCAEACSGAVLALDDDGANVGSAHILDSMRPWLVPHDMPIWQINFNRVMLWKMDASLTTSDEEDRFSRMGVGRIRLARWEAHLQHANVVVFKEHRVVARCRSYGVDIRHGQYRRRETPREPAAVCTHF